VAICNTRHGAGGHMKTLLSGRAKLLGRSFDSGGAVILFALFVCLAIASSIQLLTVAALCSERALADELSGRRRLAQIDLSLAALADQAKTKWGPIPWTRSAQVGAPLTWRLTESDEARDWVLRAEVLYEGVPERVVTSAFVERGRDGLDLPGTAVVATSVRVAGGRDTPWMIVDSEQGEGRTSAVACVKQADTPEQLGPGCSLEFLAAEWRLDDGWRRSLEGGGLSGQRVLVLSGSEGDVVTPSGLVGASTRQQPILVIVIGGATVDLREVGELWGVVVADQGSIVLEETVVHGAVFASESVQFGSRGQVDFCSDVLRWATDRSLERVRLVPGTRVEDTE
jgi:hypothetical protein